jgi:hypothetical protein
MANKITLATLVDQLAKMGARLEKGFASLDRKIGKLDTRMERGFAAVAEDISDIRDGNQGPGRHAPHAGRLNRN